MSKIFHDVCDQFNALPNVAKILIGTTAVVVPGYLLLCRKKQPVSSPLKTDYKTGVVYLYQFPRTLVIPNLSPYCLKLETWLRMANINYEVKFVYSTYYKVPQINHTVSVKNIVQNVDCPIMTRSSKGLLPFVELNGKQYADSGFIIRDLSRIYNKDELESSLSAEQKACARAFEQMIENSTTP